MISNKHATSPKREDEWGPYLYTDLYIYGKYIVIKRPGWTDTILFRKICDIGDNSRQWYFFRQRRSHKNTTHILIFTHTKIRHISSFLHTQKSHKIVRDKVVWKSRHDNNPNHRMALRSPNWPNLVNSSKSVSLIRGEDLWSWNC